MPAITFSIVLYTFHLSSLGWKWVRSSSPKTNGRISLTFEELCGMLSLLLCLKFTCTGCGGPTETTLQCEGQSVVDNEGAAVKIACPCCGAKNQVIFTPDGTIHGVMRARTYERIPVMSVN
jgi:hypothetical protein